MAEGDVLMGWDLAPRKCGWCAGDGSKTPIAGAFTLPPIDDDLGELLVLFHAQAQILIDRFRPTVMVIERPILPTGGGKFRNQVMGSLLQRRAQFCMGPHLEWMGKAQGFLCEEADPFDVKRALTGSPKSEKKDMVRMAEKIGVTLPPTLAAGREDAADAVGCWLIAVREHARRFLPDWDRRVFSPRGGLL